MKKRMAKIMSAVLVSAMAVSMMEIGRAHV